MRNRTKRVLADIHQPPSRGFGFWAGVDVGAMVILGLDCRTCSVRSSLHTILSAELEES
jgi:hypothetical protein